ncbi:hypothetical protein B0H19DRAFT_1268014 [Mycena capillaripes]|nr:hypothetical protein B0H19DRAFT_1268014 [Mycena capillaripes]
MLIDAAKAADVKGVVSSGLVSITKLSGGKYAQTYHFDGKEYGRTSGVPFVNVLAGFYASSFAKMLKNSPTELTMENLAVLGAPHIVDGLIGIFLFFDEFGYYGGQPSASQESLARPTRTCVEFAKVAD